MELSLRAGCWGSIMSGGIPEAETLYRCQPVIMRMKGRESIVGVCCTRHVLYSVSTRDHDMATQSGMT
jgi:hypothetical protein